MPELIATGPTLREIRIALMASGYRRRWATVDGRKWWTNGLCAFEDDSLSAGDVALTDQEEYGPLVKLVREWLNENGSAAEVRRGLRQNTDADSKVGVMREIGDGSNSLNFDEALYSAFRGFDVQLLLKEGAATFWSEGRIVGLLMKMSGEPREYPAMKEATPEQIYRHIACDLNGWFFYPGGASAAVSKEIAKLEEYLREKQDELGELESEIDTTEADLRRLRSRLGELTTKGGSPC